MQLLDRALKNLKAARPPYKSSYLKQDFTLAIQVFSSLESETLNKYFTREKTALIESKNPWCLDLLARLQVLHARTGDPALINGVIQGYRAFGQINQLSDFYVFLFRHVDEKTKIFIINELFSWLDKDAIQSVLSDRNPGIDDARYELYQWMLSVISGEPSDIYKRIKGGGEILSFYLLNAPRYVQFVYDSVDRTEEYLDAVGRLLGEHLAASAFVLLEIARHLSKIAGLNPRAKELAAKIIERGSNDIQVMRAAMSCIIKSDPKHALARIEASKAMFGADDVEDFISHLGLVNGEFQRRIAETIDNEFFYINELQASNSPSKQVVNFHAVIWGNPFYEVAAREFGVRSLLTSNAFRRLVERYKVIFTVYTTPSSLDMVVRAYQAVLDLGISVRLNTSVLKSDEKALRYRGLAYHHALVTGELKSEIVVNFSPDAIFGEGFDTLIDRCPLGGASSGLLIRSSEIAICELLNSPLDLTELYASQDRNKILYHLGRSEWYHFCQELRFSARPPHQGTRQQNGRTTCFTAYPLSLVVRPVPGLSQRIASLASVRYSGPYLDHCHQPLDHEFSRYAAANNLLFVATHPDVFCVVEMTKDAGYSNFEKSLEYSNIFDFKIRPDFDIELPCI